MNKLSVILPAFNEEAMIARAYKTLRRVLDEAEISFELIFVDDGSTDGTWTEIEKMSQQDARVLGLHFSRNFGKEAAVYAGLAQASGAVTAVMDCDLQHPPEKLPEMYRLWLEGYEVIEGIKKSRGSERVLNRCGAGFFYRLMSRAAGVDMRNASDFKMLDARAVKSILSMPEQNLFFRAASSWIGYRSAAVEFEVQERVAGESKWSVWSLFQYAFTNIVAFTTVPLQFVTVGGVLCLVGSMFLLVYTLVQYFLGNAVEGYTTTLLVLLFIGSAVMMSLGVIGYYIARIYEEVKRRPRYIISDIVRGKNVSDGDSHEKNVFDRDNERNGDKVF